MTDQSQCPCGSGQTYAACCGAYIDGEAVPQWPELLMRSRYTAFTQRNKDYLLQTWHESTRPEDLVLEEGVSWFGLEIIDCPRPKVDDCGAWVEFKASFNGHDRLQCLHERSRFLKQDGRWFYVDGEYDRPGKSAKIGRNDPCPCGSGKKYKRCCG